MRAFPRVPGGLSLGTTRGSFGRSCADACFRLANRAPRRHSPRRSRLVPCERLTLRCRRACLSPKRALSTRVLPPLDRYGIVEWLGINAGAAGTESSDPVGGGRRGRAA